MVHSDGSGRPDRAVGSVRSGESSAARPRRMRASPNFPMCLLDIQLLVVLLRSAKDTPNIDSLEMRL